MYSIQILRFLVNMYKVSVKKSRSQASIGKLYSIDSRITKKCRTKATWQSKWHRAAPFSVFSVKKFLKVAGYGNKTLKRGYSLRLKD